MEEKIESSSIVKMFKEHEEFCNTYEGGMNKEQFRELIKKHTGLIIIDENPFKK